MIVHITQAEEMYTALKMRGVLRVSLSDTLVRVMVLREPRHRADQLTRTIEWF
jgi:hypothetical protein